MSQINIYKKCGGYKGAVSIYRATKLMQSFLYIDLTS